MMSSAPSTSSTLNGLSAVDDMYSSNGSVNGNATSSDSTMAFDNTVVPPSHEARTLVLCFDGTGDQFDADVSALDIV